MFFGVFYLVTIRKKSILTTETDPFMNGGYMKKTFVLFLMVVGFTILSAQDHFGSLSRINDVLYLIRANYVSEEQIGYNDLLIGAMNGIFERLDPHSHFYPEKEFEEFNDDIDGIYEGVGMEIDKRGEYIIVVSPFEGSPAEQAGVKPGDRIVEVSGESAIGWQHADITKRLRGKAGTKVTIAVEREGHPSKITITMTRAEIISKSVTLSFMMNSDVGYIRFTQFQQNSLVEMKEALSALEKSGMKRLIIDLRGNPGGILSVAHSIADLFIDDGIIVTTKGRNPQANETYPATKNTPYKNIPLVLLVDEGSASASEIFAGAVKDLKRGTLIGSKTYGKGSVQRIFPLADNSGIKMTIALYYTPSGICVDKNGIVPDYVVPKKVVPAQIDTIDNANWFRIYASKHAHNYSLTDSGVLSADPVDDFIAFLHKEKADMLALLLPDPVFREAFSGITDWESRVVKAMHDDVAVVLTYNIIEYLHGEKNARKHMLSHDSAVLKAIEILNEKK